jgi:thioredoxin reductase (NADPH)
MARYDMTKRMFGSQSMQSEIVILGSGPAGLQAAIHASKRKASVAVIGRIRRSSLNRAHIDNYICMHGITEGTKILEMGKEQAKTLGAHFIEEDIVELKQDEPFFSAKTEAGKSIESKAVIVATGVSRDRLFVPGEKRLRGRGVSYCADCDASFFKGKTVVVVGGRSAAASATILLSAFAKKVYLVTSELEVDERLAEQVKVTGVEILSYPSIASIEGADKVSGIELPDGKKLGADGVFVELGSKGAFDLAATLGVAVTPEGFIETNKKQETNVRGIFAAGDICGPPFQVAKALGEGCIAGINAATYVRGLSKNE